MHRLLTLILILSLSSGKLYGQSIQAERAKLTLFNISFNGIAAGLGVMINKSEDQRPGQAFLSGFKKGAVGGAFIDIGFRSERLSVFNSYLIKPDLSFKEKSKFYKGLSKYLYFDLNGPVMWITYYLQSGRPHNCRFLEQEAENFASGAVYRCLHN